MVLSGDNSWYNNDRLETIEHNNFFSIEQVETIKNGYAQVTNKIAEVVGKNPKDIRITELKYDPLIINGKNQAANLNKNSIAQDTWKIYAAYADDKRKFNYTLDDEKLNKEIYSLDLSWLVESVIWLNEGFEKIGRHGKVYRGAIQNFFEGFEIHCDGVDVKCKTKTRKELNVLETLDPNVYKPFKPKKFIQQGLVTLQNDKPLINGTVIFNQWFPFSVYWDYFNKIDGEFSRPSREATSFRSGESIIRFGQEFRNITHTPASDEDVQAVLKDSNKPKYFGKDLESWIRPSMYGLTIDKIVMFDQPGKLNSWDNKTLHITKPFRIAKILGADKESRLTLQYETIDPNDF